MAEAAAAGVPPHIVLDYTHRMLFAAMKGAVIHESRQRKGQLWAAWSTANFTRAKKLPDLEPLLRKLDLNRVNMTAKEIRSAVFDMAKRMGATVIRYKKGEG